MMYPNRITATFKRTILIVLISGFLGACATQRPLFDAALITKKDSKIASQFSPIPRHERVMGKSCLYSILFIPLNAPATINKAIEDALKDVKADGLADMSIESSVVFTELYNNSCYRVSGIPVVRNSAKVGL
jgi:hypothetical protein